MVLDIVEGERGPKMAKIHAGHLYICLFTDVRTSF